MSLRDDPPKQRDALLAIAARHGATNLSPSPHFRRFVEADGRPI